MPQRTRDSSQSFERADTSEGQSSGVAPGVAMNASTAGSIPHRLTINYAVLDRVNKALDHIRAGKMVILVDDEDRENEGDLCMAAELVTPAAVNFMALYGRGLISTRRS
jgi:3,4-dihydroxy 2-butanone 4-phosphate synthase/GTP cyclohydrolase II